MVRKTMKMLVVASDCGIRADVGGRSGYPEENDQASDQALVARLVGRGRAQQRDEFDCEEEAGRNIGEGELDGLEARSEEGAGEAVALRRSRK